VKVRRGLKVVGEKKESEVQFELDDAEKVREA
jgi:hypothetical protein